MTLLFDIDVCQNVIRSTWEEGVVTTDTLKTIKILDHL